jgi:hypothetical protein
MIDSRNQHVDEAELTLFYQLLSVSPILASMLYEPRLDEGVRAWLNDLYEAAPASRKRWLRLLYHYYGVVTGTPMSYREIAEAEGRAMATIRDQIARGLRYLWYQTRVETDADPAWREELFHRALARNEWVTADTRDTVSLTFFEHVAVTNGQIASRILTPKAPTEGSTERAAAHKMNDPNLWHPEHVELAPERVIMKGGKPVSTD